MQATQSRVDFRTTPETKTIIERAAAILGMSLSDYATSTLLERSRQVIEKQEERVLSDRDRDVFLALLDAPANPNAALRCGAEEFRQAVESGALKV